MSSHAEKCPVCNGRGTVWPSAIHSGTTSTQDCHGCCGWGWVTVGDIRRGLPGELQLDGPEIPDTH